MRKKGTLQKTPIKQNSQPLQGWGRVALNEDQQRSLQMMAASPNLSQSNSLSLNVKTVSPIPEGELCGSPTKKLQDSVDSNQDNLILNNLEEYEEDGSSNDDELVSEVERKKEELMEKFFEKALERKLEEIDRVTAECRAAGVSRAEEKEKIQEVGDRFDELRKKGMQTLKEKLTAFLEEGTPRELLEKLEGNQTEIDNFMKECLQ